MAEINAKDISVYKNGVWRSLSGAKVYKNGVWQDFQGVAKNGNWYKLQNGKIYIQYTGASTYLYLTKTLTAPLPGARPRWNVANFDTLEVSFGTTLSDGQVLEENKTLYIWLMSQPPYLSVELYSFENATAGKLIDVKAGIL